MLGRGDTKHMAVHRVGQQNMKVEGNKYAKNKEKTDKETDAKNLGFFSSFAPIFWISGFSTLLMAKTFAILLWGTDSTSQWE